MVNSTEDVTLTTTGTPSRNLYLALSVVEMVICLLGSAGNVLTCFAVMRSKKLHSATYFFVLSLSIADFLITSILVPVRAAEHLSVYRQTTPPGRDLIRVVVFIGRATILASLSSLAALSIDRYLALRYPIKYRASIRYNFTQIFVIIASLWVLSLVFTSIPILPGVSALQGLFIFVVLVFFMTFIMITSSWQVFRLLKQLSLRLQHFKLTVLPSKQFSRRNKTTCHYTEIENSPRITRPRSQSLPVPFEMNGIMSRFKMFDNKAFNLERDSQPVRLLTVTPFKHSHFSHEADNHTSSTSCSYPSPQLKRSAATLNGKHSRPQCMESAVTHTNKLGQQFIGSTVTRKNQLSPQCNGSVVTTHSPMRSTMVRHLADGYIAKTIVIIIGTFVLCIYPRIILIIYHLNFPETSQTAICRLWLKVLLYMNSVINPILYAWRFKDFRREFVSLITTFKRTIC